MTRKRNRFQCVYHKHNYNSVKVPCCPKGSNHFAVLGSRVGCSLVFLGCSWGAPGRSWVLLGAPGVPGYSCGCALVRLSFLWGILRGILRDLFWSAPGLLLGAPGASSVCSWALLAAPGCCWVPLLVRLGAPRLSLG